MDERTELLEKYENLIDALALINESVPELKKMQASISQIQGSIKENQSDIIKMQEHIREDQSDVMKLQEQIRSNMETQLAIAANHRNVVTKAKDEVEEALKYVKDQEEKLKKCLDQFDDIAKTVAELGDIIKELLDMEKASKKNEKISLDEEYDDLWGNSTEIDENQEAYEELETADGFIKLIIDSDLSRIQLHFLSYNIFKPYIDEIHDSNFSWNKTGKYWGAPITDENYEFAKSIINEYDEIEE